MDDFECVGSIKVKDGLYMGDEYAAQDIDQLMMNKINYIINCAGKDSYNYWESEGIVYMTINWQDNDSQALFEPKSNLHNQIFEFIEIALTKGESVLVHSARGQNRCTAAMVAYLMKKYRWSLRKSLEFLRAKRPNLPLRPSFFNQLLSLENKLFQMALEGRTDTWHEVSDIPGSDELVVTHTFLNTKIVAAESTSDVSTAKSSKPQSKISWAEQLTSQAEIECYTDDSQEYEDSEDEENVESKTSLAGLVSDNEQETGTATWTVKSNVEGDFSSLKSVLRGESRYASSLGAIPKIVTIAPQARRPSTDIRDSSRSETTKNTVIRKIRPSSSSTHSRPTQSSKARVSSATRKEEKVVEKVKEIITPATPTPATPSVVEEDSNSKVNRTSVVSNTTNPNNGNVINITINNFITGNSSQPTGKQLQGRKLTSNPRMKKSSNSSSASNLDLYSLFAKSDYVPAEQPQTKINQQRRPVSTAGAPDRERDYENWNRTPVTESVEPLSITGLSTGKFTVKQTFNNSAPNFRKNELPLRGYCVNPNQIGSTFNNSMAGLYQQRPSDYAHQGRFLPIKVVSNARFFESNNVINNTRGKSFRRPASAAVTDYSKNPLKSPYYHPSNNSLHIKKARSDTHSTKVRTIAHKENGSKNVVIRSKLRSPSPADMKYHSSNYFFTASH